MSKERDLQFNEILKLMSNGFSLTQACKKIGVARTTFLDATKRNPELSDQYARAREDLIEKLADEIMEISDEQPETITDDKGVTRFDSAAVQHQRLRVDTRKWLLSKVAPKKYGEKVTLAGDDENPLKVETITRRIIKPEK